MHTYRIECIGRVHAVGFRAYVRECAQRLGAQGRVQNIGHDCVRVIISVSDDALREMLRVCAQGPRGARVDCVHVYGAQFQQFDDFQIVA